MFSLKNVSCCCTCERLAMLLSAIFFTVAAILSSPLAVAQESMVNERFPVTKQQLEQHWGVDCAKIKADIFKRAKLNRLKSATSVTPVTTVVDAVFLRQLEKQLLQCSIIAERFSSKQEPFCNEFLSAKDLLTQKLHQADKKEIKIKNDIYSRIASHFRC